MRVGFDAGELAEMGPYSPHMDWLILGSLVAMAVAFVLPAYLKVVAKLADHGVALTWLGHIGVVAAVLLVGLVALAVVGGLLGVVTWLIERVSRRRDKPD